MNKFVFILMLFSFTVKAQEILPLTATETMADFIRSEETRTCFDLKTFAEDVLFKDQKLMEALKNRNPKEVSIAASRYAQTLAKDFDTAFFFYYPNARFFVRVDDKNYRGRMRIPYDLRDSSFSCFWERLPSSDVVYSRLMKLEEPNVGYIKLSKALPRMTTNLPDALSAFGVARVYTALDKEGLHKMNWFKMRQKEPNKAKEAGWCNAENLAFLSAIGNGKALPPSVHKKVLSFIDQDKDFFWDEMTITGGSFPIKDLNGRRLAAVVYTLEKKSENKEGAKITEENSKAPSN